jgi:hypothetical protein
VAARDRRRADADPHRRVARQPGFLTSDYIGSDELPLLLEAARAGEVTLVCVPVRTSVVDLARPELLEYQWPRPHDQPLDRMRRAERQGALAQIFRKLYEVASAAGLTEIAPAGSHCRLLRHKSCGAELDHGQWRSIR